MELICPYCKQLPEYIDSKEVYDSGVSYGMIYCCRPCKAWVGVHKGTSIPLGRLANAELREWKIKAHASFDPLWRKKMEQGLKKGKARRLAYDWLAKEMDLPNLLCHIALFDIDQCKQVISICKPYLK